MKIQLKYREKSGNLNLKCIREKSTLGLRNGSKPIKILWEIVKFISYIHSRKIHARPSQGIKNNHKTARKTKKNEARTDTRKIHAKSTTGAHKRSKPHQKLRQIWRKPPKFDHRNIDYRLSQASKTSSKTTANPQKSTWTAGHVKIAKRPKSKQILIYFSRFGDGENCGGEFLK